MSADTSSTVLLMPDRHQVESIHGHIRKHYTSQNPGIADIGRDVIEVIAIQLKQPDNCPEPVSEVPGT